MDTQWHVVPILLSFFALNRILDRRFNRPPPTAETARETVGNLPFGIIPGLSTLIAITIAGNFLGNAGIVHPVGLLTFLIATCVSGS
jgi:hypothetical protein